MSLSSVLYTAQSSLTNTSRQTSVVSTNITNARNSDYTHRSAVLSSTVPGARVITITRAADAALSRQNADALSSWHAQATLSAGLDRLSLGVNGVDSASSPAMRMGKLMEALQTYSSRPADRSLATLVVDAAKDLTRTLNEGTAAIQSLRTDADAEIAQSVQRLNGLLKELEDVNGAVVSATRLGQDASEALDIRDGLVKKISELVPVAAQTRTPNDLVLFSADGVTLFDTVARQATFTATPIHGAGSGGGEVFIEGIPLGAGKGGNTTGSGSISALLQLRDEVAPQMQRQLDEMARALIQGFREFDAASETAGLFTWSGNATVGAGTMLSGDVTGLAGAISINAAYVANPLAVRDGTVFSSNPGGEAGFSGTIDRYAEMFSTLRVFNGAAGIGENKTLSDFATGSVSWLEAARKASAEATEKKSALLSRTGEALSNKTGVNVDDELAQLLALEQSYAASAKLMQAANEMLATLMATVR